MRRHTVTGAGNVWKCCTDWFGESYCSSSAMRLRCQEIEDVYTNVWVVDETYLTRGFGSFQGSVAFSILFTLYYNYLHPSDRFNDRPIVQIDGLNYSHPVLAWKGLIEKATAA